MSATCPAFAWGWLNLSTLARVSSKAFRDQDSRKKAYPKMTPSISTLCSYDSQKKNVLTCSFYIVPCTWICNNVQLSQTWWHWITLPSSTVSIHMDSSCFLLKYSKQVRIGTQFRICICCLPLLICCQISFLYSFTWMTIFTHPYSNHF